MRRKWRRWAVCEECGQRVEGVEEIEQPTESPCEACWPTGTALCPQCTHEMHMTGCTYDDHPR